MLTVTPRVAPMTFSMPFAAVRVDSSFLQLCWFDLSFVREHSVEVDPGATDAVRAFCDFTIEGDLIVCWLVA